MLDGKWMSNLNICSIWKYVMSLSIRLLVWTGSIMKHEEHACNIPQCFTHLPSEPVWLFQVAQIMNVVWVFSVCSNASSLILQIMFIMGEVQL